MKRVPRLITRHLPVATSLLALCLCASVVHYSAPNLRADCPCGADCVGTCCDCGCSDVHQTQCPNGMCPNCPNGQCYRNQIPFDAIQVISGPSISPEAEDPMGDQSTAAVGPLWNWTPDADYQRAVAIVRCASDKPGQMDQMSGGYVKFGEVTGVITAAHGIHGGTAKVTFSDGTETTGQALTDRDGNDVAFVVCANDRISPLELAPGLAAGATVEYVTLGGPESRLRHFAGRVIGPDAGQVAIDAHVVSGDSGGIILNERHQVATVQSCGVGQAVAYDAARERLYRPPAKKGDWTVFNTSTAPTNQSVLAFMQRVHDRLYPTGNVNVLCFGGRCQQGAAQPPAAASPLYPPAKIPSPQSPAPSPQLSNQPILNRLDSLEQNLAAKLDKLPIPLGSQLDTLKQDLKQQIAGLPVPPNLGPIANNLEAAHQKLDALVTNAGAVKQKLDDFNSTAVGQTVKTAVDGAVAPVLQKLAAPVAAELGMPALATLGLAGGVPGLIGTALIALFLKKKLTPGT